MNKDIAKKIFSENNLGEIESFEKIEVGFTNKVYDINDQFILKVCEDEKNERMFEVETFFYNFFKNKITVPDVKIFDKSKKIYDKFFMIYPKIVGDNLYALWHLLNNEQRKSIIGQLCDILKVINNAPYDDFKKKFQPEFDESWHDKIIGQINASLQEIEKKKLLSSDFVQVIKKFVGDHHQVLREQKLALVYWDAHFDNIIIKDNKIVGILDFERVEISSIDFVLDIIKRMMDYPKKYMSEKTEKFARHKDYAQLMKWFKEFYPELFEFENLETRLALYALEHDLKDIIGWPSVPELKNMVARTVGYKI